MRKIIVGLAPIAIALAISGAACAAPNYTEGHVWRFSFIKANSSFKDDYLDNLAANYHRELDEAKKQGVILSYKVIEGDYATKDDWNVIIMLEFNNMASLDGFDEKMDAIAAKVIGAEADKKGDVVRSNLREYLGIKLAREIIFK